MITNEVAPLSGTIEATKVAAFYYDERAGRHCMEMQDGTRSHVDF